MEHNELFWNWNKKEKYTFSSFIQVWSLLITQQKKHFIIRHLGVFSTFLSLSVSLSDISHFHILIITGSERSWCDSTVIRSGEPSKQPDPGRVNATNHMVELMPKSGLARSCLSVHQISQQSSSSEVKVGNQTQVRGSRDISSHARFPFPVLSLQHHRCLLRLRRTSNVRD